MARFQPTGIRIGAQGRLVLPAQLRHELNLRPGDTVVAMRRGGDVVLRPRRAVEQELWKLMARARHGLAAELIRERRAGARHENRS